MTNRERRAGTRGSRLDTTLADRIAHLPPPARRLLADTAALALALGAAPYLVGGSVRDLLLGRATIDLDVVVVGEAIAVARALHAALGGEARARLRVHETFGTANLALHDGPALDLITARREVYPEPGALPVVAPGSLDDDLRRRDFTINAMALDLAPARFGALIDPLGGRGDLAARTVRILHPASFSDDPTRLLRAIRYAGRLAFALDPATAALAAAAFATGAPGTISIQRLSHEFVRLLAEPAAAAMLDHLRALDGLAPFGAQLRWDEAARAAFRRLDRCWPLVRPDRARRFDLWTARFALLVAHLAPEEARAAAGDLHLTTEAIDLAGQVAQARTDLAAMPLPATNAALGRSLDRFDTAAIATIAAMTPDETARKRLAHYLTAIRPLAPTLTGDALKHLRVPPGPIYRRILQALLDYKRDNPAATVADEWAFLRARLWDEGVRPPPPPAAGGSSAGGVNGAEG